MTQDELGKLLEENIRITRETQGLLKALHRQAIWHRIQWGLKLVVLVALVYTGYVTLPPIYNQYIAPYQALFSQAYNQVSSLKPGQKSQGAPTLPFPIPDLSNLDLSKVNLT